MAVMRGLTRAERLGILAALVTGVVCIAAAPLALGPAYDVVNQSVSESAAQGTSGSWVGRTGLAAFGLAALLATRPAAARHGRWVAWALGVFGVGITTSALWSHAPWAAGIGTDAFEDLLHSVASSVAGFGFTMAMLLILVDSIRRRRPNLLAAAALVWVIAVPILMGAGVGPTGILQRSIFAVAAVWIAALTLGRG